MTSTGDAVLLFDLDGTILDSNSFPVWVAEMALGRLAPATVAGRIVLSARSALAIGRRKVLRGSHHDFKRRLQRIWAGAVPHGREDEAAERLVSLLLLRVRPSLRPLLDEVASGAIDALLTTAAAAEYAIPLGRRLGFRHVVATPAARDGDSTDNVGAVKRDRTLALLGDTGWIGRPRILFTDHADDLPLIDACSAVVWFGSPHDRARLDAAPADRPWLCAAELPASVVTDWVRARLRSPNARCAS
jgi:phosphoserine phosphatase